MKNVQTSCHSSESELEIHSSSSDESLSASNLSRISASKKRKMVLKPKKKINSNMAVTKSSSAKQDEMLKKMQTRRNHSDNEIKQNVLTRPSNIKVGLINKSNNAATITNANLPHPSKIFMILPGQKFGNSYDISGALVKGSRRVLKPVDGPVSDEFLDYVIESCQQQVLSTTATQARRDTLLRRLAELTGGKDLSDIVGRACLAGTSLVHRKMLLKEMSWMSDDFQKEKQRHRGYRRKLSKSIQLHDKNKEAREARKEREELASMKRNAAKISREVRHFWGKLNRVIAYKQKLEADEMRRKAMDKHLVFLVKQTERYTTMLATHNQGESAPLICAESSFSSTLNKERPERKSANCKNFVEKDIESSKPNHTDDDSSDGSKTRSAKRQKTKQVHRMSKDSKHSIQYDSDSSISSFEEEQDDETTLEQAEKEDTIEGVQDELAALNAEAELSVEELMLQYMSGQNQGDDFSENISEHSDDLSEKSDNSDIDTNIAAEREAKVKKQSISLGKGKSHDRTTKVLNSDVHDQIDDDIEDSNEADDKRTMETENLILKIPRHSNSQKGQAIIEIDDETEKVQATNALLRLNAADEAARSIQVPRPFLLSPGVRLREYQHVGLNWLVSLHERRLNGILADEMGLGKTLQTVALLAYLACFKGIWGPHLIVVPTSCIVNWEMELKLFCPGFKVLTYYGNTKKRKELRYGWKKSNQFHVCVTSYQLAVQDASTFKRKRWFYLILDEAHNIKNFKSLRWQTLLTFNSQRRLLLTGTPLQNNLMELWSLMHFLMPHIFSSRKEFSYWFSQPLSSMVEGSRNVSGELVSRLHSIMRPFLLRRLKKDVAKQLPAKVEHVLMCRLSRRQALLYEEFMSRSSTRSALSGGGQFMGMMNVLMQLRKVCNHPDLFEPRPTVSPFIMNPITYNPGGLISKSAHNLNAYEHRNPGFNSPGGYANWSEVSQEIKQFLWSPATLGGSFSGSGAMDSCALTTLNALKAPKDYIVEVDDLNLPIPDPEKMNRKSELTPRIALLLTKLREDCCSDVYAARILMSKVSDRRCSPAVNPLDWRKIEKLSIFEKENPLILAIKSQDSGLMAARKGVEVPSIIFPLVTSYRSRHDEIRPILTRFTFTVPRALSWSPIFVPKHEGNSSKNEKFSLKLKELGGLDLLHISSSRLRIWFPERNLVQYDSGKLQKLSILLRERKSGGHKCLIFTQMTRMLDVLEKFLAMQGYTYVRLDGSTGVEKRQRLMDRFNTDEKLFCFILSTRSGGLGVNLTGADTVIFFDSDWNPAMDSQAQDRAHRIGQTRDVHIYRLITQATVEENILLKARQKRHLDHLVMTEGNFNADYMTSGGLRDIFGVSEPDNTEEVKGASVSVAEIEQAMASLEDADDVEAGRALKQEAENEAQEFDDNPADNLELGEEKEKIPLNEQDAVQVAEEIDKTDEQLEQEFSAWQDKIGLDPAVIEASLLPIERYALRVRETVDPFYSLYYRSEEQRMLELRASANEEPIDIDEVERIKELEEKKQVENGDLLVCSMLPEDISEVKIGYMNERARQKAQRVKRHMTGEAWEQRPDGATRVLFWFNVDTGQAIWEEPLVVSQQKAYKYALKTRYSGLALPILLRILFYLTPMERRKAALVNDHWLNASIHQAFELHVIPSEFRTHDGKIPTLEPSQHIEEYQRTFSTLSEALHMAESGDTIVLDSGHHWEHEALVDKPLKIIGEGATETSEDYTPGGVGGVTIELTGTIVWKARGGMLSGITIRRPKLCLDVNHMLHINDNGAYIHASYCFIDNEFGSQNNAAIMISTSSGSSIFRHCAIEKASGIGFESHSWNLLTLRQCRISNCFSDGFLLGSSACAYIDQCEIQNNKGFGVKALSASICTIENSDCSGNVSGPVECIGSLKSHHNQCKDAVLPLPQGFDPLWISQSPTEEQDEGLSEGESAGDMDAESLDSQNSSCYKVVRKPVLRRKPSETSTHSTRLKTLFESKTSDTNSLPNAYQKSQSMKSKLMMKTRSSAVLSMEESRSSFSETQDSPQNPPEEEKPAKRYLKRFVDDDSDEPVLKIVIPKKARLRENSSKPSIEGQSGTWGSGGVGSGWDSAPSQVNNTSTWGVSEGESKGASAWGTGNAWAEKEGTAITAWKPLEPQKDLSSWAPEPKSGVPWAPDLQQCVNKLPSRQTKKSSSSRSWPTKDPTCWPSDGAKDISSWMPEPTKTFVRPSTWSSWQLNGGFDNEPGPPVKKKNPNRVSLASKREPTFFSGRPSKDPPTRLSDSKQTPPSWFADARPPGSPSPRNNSSPWFTGPGSSSSLSPRNNTPWPSDSRNKPSAWAVDTGKKSSSWSVAPKSSSPHVWHNDHAEPRKQTLLWETSTQHDPTVFPSRPKKSPSKWASEPSNPPPWSVSPAQEPGQVPPPWAVMSNQDHSPKSSELRGTLSALVLESKQNPPIYLETWNGGGIAANNSFLEGKIEYQPSNTNFVSSASSLPRYDSSENKLEWWVHNATFEKEDSDWSNSKRQEVQLQVPSDDNVWRKYGRNRGGLTRPPPNLRNTQSNPRYQTPSGRVTPRYNSAHNRDSRFTFHEGRGRGRDRGNVHENEKGGIWKNDSLLHSNWDKPNDIMPRNDDKTIPNLVSNANYVTEEGEIVCTSQMQIPVNVPVPYERHAGMFTNATTYTYPPVNNNPILDNLGHAQDIPPPPLINNSVELDHVAKMRALAAARAGAMWLEDGEFLPDYEVPPQENTPLPLPNFNYEPPEEGELVPPPPPNFPVPPPPPPLPAKGPVGRAQNYLRERVSYPRNPAWGDYPPPNLPRDHHPPPPFRPYR